MKHQKIDQPTGPTLTTTKPSDYADPPEARCQCGQLVAKLTDDGIELKCKRCKRLVLLPFTSFKSGEVSMNVCSDRLQKNDDSLDTLFSQNKKGTF